MQSQGSNANSPSTKRHPKRFPSNPEKFSLCLSGFSALPFLAKKTSVLLLVQEVTGKCG